MAVLNRAISHSHNKKGKLAGKSLPDNAMEQLVRRLIRHVINNPKRPPELQVDINLQQAIFDFEVDGVRCLLVRREIKPFQRNLILSPREMEIVRMVAKGHPNKVIADVLDISPWTVCTHLRRIFAKLGVGSRAAMVAEVLKENLIAKPSRDDLS
jgi:DNA-binding CsgD family transcriptional regulator